MIKPGVPVSLLAIALVSSAAAQTTTLQNAITPEAVIDSGSPPAGFSGPRPSGPHDVSMAKYARDSFLDGEEGVVDLRILVRADGTVGNSEISRSSGSPRLDDAAKALVRDWRYQPATLNGAPVAAWVRVSIIWALQALRFRPTAQLSSNFVWFWPKSAPTGVSTVRFLVMPDGKVSKVLIDLPSGSPALDQASIKMITSSWRIDPRALMTMTGNSVGGWFRTVLGWGAKQNPEERAGCYTPDDDSGLDAILTACTQFLTKPDLTPYAQALAYLARGTVYARKFERELAVQEFNLAIRASPGLAAPFLGRGQAYLALGKKDLALNDFDSAVEVEPLWYAPYSYRAEAYLAVGQKNMAMEDFDRALRLASREEQASVYNRRCYQLSAMGKQADGLADCNKALDLNPDDSTTLDFRGYTYFRLGRYQEAIKDYDAALRKNPRLAASLYGRGVTKLKLGNASGRSDMDAAAAIEPTIAKRMAEVGVTP